MSFYHPYIVARCWYVNMCAHSSVVSIETKGSGKVKWDWREVVFCTNATIKGWYNDILGLHQNFFYSNKILNSYIYICTVLT